MVHSDLDTHNEFTNPLAHYVLNAAASGTDSAAAEHLYEMMVDDWARRLLAELEALLARYRRRNLSRDVLRECLFDTIREWEPIDWFYDYLRALPKGNSTSERRRALGYKFVKLRDRYMALKAVVAAGDRGATSRCSKDLRDAIDSFAPQRKHAWRASRRK